MSKVYQALKKEWLQQGGYDRNRETMDSPLNKIYWKAYFNGLDGPSYINCEFLNSDSTTAEERKAYIAGYFFGDYEAWECDD